MTADLFLTGRSKEVINRGGELISPVEVEEAIHPAVSKICMVFSVGMDDSRETDKVLADPNLATGPLYHIWAVELSEQTVNDLCLWPSCRHGWWHTGWASRRQSS